MNEVKSSRKLYPAKISIVHITDEMREELNKMIWPERGITEAAVVRSAIQHYIALQKKAKGK